MRTLRKLLLHRIIVDWMGHIYNACRSDTCQLRSKCMLKKKNRQHPNRFKLTMHNANCSKMFSRNYSIRLHREEYILFRQRLCCGCCAIACAVKVRDAICKNVSISLWLLLLLNFCRCHWSICNACCWKFSYFLERFVKFSCIAAERVPADRYRLAMCCQ